MRTLLIYTCCVMVVLVVTLISIRAGAAEGGRLIAVHVDGPGADAVRAGIVEVVLPSGVRIVDRDVFSKALRVNGAAQKTTGSGNGNNNNNNNSGDDIDVVCKAAIAVHADVVLIGHVQRTKSGPPRLRLIYVDPSVMDLKPQVDQTITLPIHGERKALEGALDAWLEELAPVNELTRTKAAAPVNNGGATIKASSLSSSSAASASPSDTVITPSPRDGQQGRNDVSTELFEIGLGVEIFGRTFRYSDPHPTAASRLRPYDLDGALAAAASGAVYPFAMRNVPVLRDIGLTGELSHAVGLSSQRNGAEEQLQSSAIGTSYNRYRLAVRGRIHTGGARSSPVIGIRGGYGHVSFGFDAPKAPLTADSLPSVAYSFLDAGLDARVPVDRFAFFAGADYLAMLAAGDVANRFRGSNTGGIEMRAGASAGVVAGFEARLTASYARYFYSFDPTPGDPYVAGGALDELYALSLGGAYVF